MEKRSIKVPLLVVLLVLALIIILALGAWVYILEGKVKDAKTAQDAKVVEYGVSNNVDNKEQNNNEVKNETTRPKEKYAIDTTQVEEDNISTYDQDAYGIYGLYIYEAKDNKDGTYTLRGIEVTDYNMDLDSLEDIEKAGKMTIDDVEYKLVEPEMKNSETKYELQDKNGEALYEIIMEEDNLFKVIRLAQLSTVYQYAEGFAEVTVSEDLEIDRDFNEPITVKERFKDFKFKKVQLTKEDIRDIVLHENESTYDFEFDDDGNVTSASEVLMSI